MEPVAKPRLLAATGQVDLPRTRLGAVPRGPPQVDTLMMLECRAGTADWEDGAALEVVQGHPEGADAPQGTPNPSGFSPQYDPSEVFEIAKRLMKKM